MWRARIEPAARTELAAERTQLLIASQAVFVGNRFPREAGRDVGVQPGADLPAEVLLLLGVRDLEVHWRILVTARSGRGALPAQPIDDGAAHDALEVAAQ